MKMDGYARRFLFWVGVLLLGASVAGDRIWAQTVPVNPTLKKKIKADIDNLVVNVELVNVLFTVTDRKGRLVTDLQQPNFKLYEDNELQEITNFSRETDLPLTIAVLIDTSTSITDRFKFEQEAAIEFLYQTLRPRKDKALLITFDSAIELVQDFTDDPQGAGDIDPTHPTRRRNQAAGQRLSHLPGKAESRTGKHQKNHHSHQRWR